MFGYESRIASSFGLKIKRDSEPPFDAYN